MKVMEITKEQCPHLSPSQHQTVRHHTGYTQRTSTHHQLLKWSAIAALDGSDDDIWIPYPHTLIPPYPHTLKTQISAQNK